MAESAELLQQLPKISRLNAGLVRQLIDVLNMCGLHEKGAEIALVANPLYADSLELFAIKLKRVECLAAAGRDAQAGREIGSLVLSVQQHRDAYPLVCAQALYAQASLESAPLRAEALLRQSNDLLEKNGLNFCRARLSVLEKLAEHCRLSGKTAEYKRLTWQCRQIEAQLELCSNLQSAPVPFAKIR